MNINRVLIVLYSIWNFTFSSECPQIQSYHNVQFYDQYSVRSFLRFPNTNVLLINTVSAISGMSIVYFNDMTTESGEIIGVVKPDYNILDMVFVSKLDLILVINPAKIILADPYTLIASQELSIQRSQSIQLIKDSNYAIVTMWYNEITILNIVSLEIVKILTNINQPNTFSVLQKFSQVYTLKNSTQIIMCTNEFGVFTWSINFSTLAAEYNGYIDAVNISPPNSGRFRVFDKYPVDDIFFFTGNSSQILIVKIIDVKNRSYLTMFNKKMYNGAYTINTFNLFYREQIIAGAVTPTLVIGETYYMYFLPMEIKATTVTISTINSPKWRDAKEHTWRWYQMDESYYKFVMACNYYITVYDMSIDKENYYLYFQTDGFQRRSMFQNSTLEMYMMLYSYTLYCSLRSDPGRYYREIPLKQQVNEARGSLNRVKMCNDCIVIRLGNGSAPNLLSSMKTVSFDLIETDYYLSTISLTWDKIGPNLDPYFYNGDVYVVLSFPFSTYSPSGYLFLLLNVSTGTTVKLKVGPTDPNNLNLKKSSFVIISYEDPSNQQIIGIDLEGNIHSWNLSNQAYQFSKYIPDCKNAQIGDIYHYQSNKWLIIVCQDLIPRVFDFLTNTTTELLEIKLYSYPLALKAYSNLGIIIITDYSIGDTHIYKFDSLNQSFSFFITLTKGKLKDTIIGVELLQDNTLWIQYTLSNFFFSIEDCLEQVDKCKYCTQTFYFNATETHDQNGLYGYGNRTHPFTGSANYYTAMIKAQQYTDLVGDTKVMKVNIKVDPSNPMKLRDGLLNCKFSSIIDLTFESAANKTAALANVNLNIENQLKFSGYNQVMLKDTTLNFTFISPNSINDCGIAFDSPSDGVAILQNFRINNLDCQRITANSTNLSVDSFEIIGRNLTNYGSIFTINNSKNLNITSLRVKDVRFGKDTSIVSSGSQLNLQLSNIEISNSKCAEINDPIYLSSSISTPLISAGLIIAQGLSVIDNHFCKKSILVATTSLEHINYAYSLSDVILKNNIFEATSEHLFFSALYFQRVFPSHSLTLNNVTFFNNQLQLYENSQIYLSLATMMSVSRIEKINFTDVHIENQDQISLAKLEYSISVGFNIISCSNSYDAFSAQIPDTLSIGCFALYEIKSFEITNLNVDRKKAYDAPLILLSNVEYSDSQLIMQSSSFTNLVVIQTKDNTNASPLIITSVNNMNIIIDTCSFYDNILDGRLQSFTFSTTAIYIENYIGNVNIIKSIFDRSSSNSRYNFIYLSCRLVYLERSTFSNQSFLSETKSTQIKGGFIHAQTTSIDIQKCTFQKSFAETGAFIFAKAFGEGLIFNISETKFEEGFALANGGAIYFDLATSLLSFTCLSCTFNNIFTLQDGASVLTFSQEKNDESKKHQIIFEKGSLTNWRGFGDNFFASFNNFNFSMNEFSNIRYDESYLGNAPLVLPKQFGNTENQFLNSFSQGSLLLAESSIVNITFSNIKDLKYQADSSQYPLLISATNSTLNMNNIHFENSTFSRAAIEIYESSSLNIQASEFKNISRSKITDSQNTKRELEFMFNTDLIDTSPLTSISSSMIILHDSFLKTYQSTSFDQIECVMYECNGSVFQLLNSTFYIEDTTFTHSSAQFGGAIYISGITSSNKILKSQFKSNKAEYSGGSIYLQALNIDIFDLEISNSNFDQNLSKYGRGGAMYFRSTSQNSINDTQKININSSTIINNRAQVGGSIDAKQILPNISRSTIIQGNQGILYGNSISSYPSKIEIINKESIQQKGDINLNSEGFDMVINNFQSGAYFPSITFGMFTNYNEEISYFTTSELAIYTISVSYQTQIDNAKGYTMRGSTSTKFESIGFTFSDLQFIGVPATSATLLFESDQIYRVDNTTLNYLNDYSFKVLINFRNCQSGEKNNTYSDFTECQTCAEGTYSYDFKQCYDCPIGATCKGGDKITINSGFWRLEETSSTVLNCQNQEANCAGGLFGNNICYEGHIGALCEECDIFGEYWGRSYSKSGKYTCVNCDSIANNFWIVAGLTIWTLISMTFAIKGDIHFLENKAAGDTLKRSLSRRSMTSSLSLKRTQKKKVISFIDPSILASQTNLSSLTVSGSSRSIGSSQLKRKQSTIVDEKSGIYIKMITNYIQIVGSIATFNLTIPSGIIDYPSSIGEPLRQTMNSLDCVLKDIGSTIPIIYLRLLFSQIVPMVYLMIFMIGLLIKYRNKLRNKQFPAYIVSTAVIFLIIYIQPDLVAQSISLISCREIGGRYYILSNVSHECFTDDYQTYLTVLVVPILLLWVLILPCLLFFLLKKNKLNLSQTFVKLHFGFLYKEYKEEAFYWEFIKMAEKLAIIMSLNFYSQSIVMKGILVFIIITAYGVIAMIIQPYREPLVNQLDVYSTNICAISVLLGIFIYKNEFDYFIYSALTIIIIVNCWYLFIMIKKVVHVYLNQIKGQAYEVSKILSKKFDFFKKFQKQDPLDPAKEEIKRKARLALTKFLSLSFEERKQLYLQSCLKHIEEIKEELTFSTKFLRNQREIKPLQISMTNSQDDYLEQIQGSSSKENQHSNIITLNNIGMTLTETEYNQDPKHFLKPSMPEIESFILLNKGTNCQPECS